MLVWIVENERLEGVITIEASNKRLKKLIGLYLLLFIYIILPRVSVTNYSSISILFVSLKNIFPTIASILVLILNRHQYKYKSFEKIKVKLIVLGLYSLYLLVNILQIAWLSI